MKSDDTFHLPTSTPDHRHTQISSIPSFYLTLNMSLSIKKRWEIIFLTSHKLGPQLSYKRVSKVVKCTPSTVQKWVMRWKETGEVEDEVGRGAKRKTTPKQDLAIAKAAKAAPEADASDLSVSLKRQRIDLSDRTIQRRLNEAGLSYGPVLKKPLLKIDHREKRLQFAQAHLDDDFENIIFTDESTFRLFGFKKKVWRRAGEPFVVRTVKHPAKVNVWGCFSSKGFGKLVLFTENMNAPLLVKIYNKGLLPSAAKWFSGEEDEWVLQEDRRSQTHLKVGQTMEAAEKRHPHGLASAVARFKSHRKGWAMMEVRVAQRKPQNLDALKRIIREEWKRLTPEFSTALVSSMKKRISAVIESSGDYTLY